MKTGRVNGVTIRVDKYVYNKVFSVMDPNKVGVIDLVTCNQHTAHVRASELATASMAPVIRGPVEKDYRGD